MSQVKKQAELCSAWTGEGARPYISAHVRETRSFWLQGLGDHHLALEVLDHIFFETDFGGLLGQGHRVDLVLQLEQRVKQVLRTRRAANYVDIDGHDLVDSLQHGVGIKRAADG